ncbi:ATP-dependent protease La [Marssonina coronariae]|uniref:ATP-dependent protease La n=1 Tax=Diplocarpon coronariae TaxID=2795749 RepID=A0A218ZDS9_9HELO|nr:ATP-dependent protease La [Marssonina coronariae]
MADSWEPFETREIEQMRDQIVEHSRRVRENLGLVLEWRRVHLSRLDEERRMLEADTQKHNLFMSQFDQWRRQQLNEMWGSQAYLDENLRRFLVICEEKNTQQDRREKELCDREEKVKRLQNPTYLKRHDEEMMALRCFASAMLVTDLKLQDYTRKLRQNMTECKKWIAK